MNPFLKLNITAIKDIINCLNELCLNQKLITGYNGYFELPKKNTLSLCVSNIYGGKNYEKDMIKSLETINYNMKTFFRVLEKLLKYLKKRMKMK
ncbi:MAG: hypothetical protein PHT91_01270 [Candidatus Nanoarchaeia archaeon]|nr:hypothetical protein [Candidatus Nanoarchaeia archaeon]MDD5054111.1 hypothetical protein [Candidatus Nanoarchaeia archaeon]MDD5499489.1 hypothetical protein [Candidatus Nanoarchaeia archaeon]